MTEHNSAECDRPPAGTKTVCTNCGDPIVYDPINLWIHDGVAGDPVPCDGEVPVAEPLACWDWRDEADECERCEGTGDRYGRYIFSSEVTCGHMDPDGCGCDR